MHVAAPAPAQAFLGPKHLQSHRLEVDPGSDQGRGGAVVEGKSIAHLHVGNYTGNDALLADAKVHFARDETGQPEVTKRLFEEPHLHHLLVEVGQWHL